MSLQVWLPLNGDLENKGLKNVGTSTLGTITYENGKLGQAVRIGSGTQVQNGISIDSNLLEDLGSEYSCSVWVKPTGAHVHYEGAILSSGDWNKKKWAFGIGQNNTTIDPFGPSYNIEVPCTVPVNEWTHIASTVKDNIATIYKNGVQVGTYDFGSLVLESDAANTTIGRETYAGGYFSFNGCIQDIRIYNHCLSPREVKQVSTALVLHYPLSMPGQENLYTGSRDFSGTWVSGANWTTDSEQYNGFVVKKKSSIWGGLAQNVPCSNGDIFTISFYAKVDSGGNILSIHRSSLGNVTTGLTILGGNFKSGTDWVTASDDGTEWKRYWATVEITSQDITYLQWRIENSVANKFLYVCGMKLERGSVATPWMPNSSDAAYTALGFNDGIEYDVSGYNHNGTKVGSITYDADTPRYNASTQIDGSTITCASGLVSVADPVFSVSLWFRLKSNTSYTIYQDLINFASPSYSNQPFRLEICGSPVGNDICWFRGPTGSTGGFKVNNTALSRDVWYHTVLVSEGNKQYSYYMNGVKQGTYNGSANTWTPTGSVRIGDSIAGKIDISDFRIYATALSPSDILELYHTPETLSHNGTLLTQGEFVES